MSTDLKPDPSKISGIARAPFAVLPDPGRVFARRAQRLAALAQTSHLAPYLLFLAAVSRAQADVAAALPPADPLPAARLARAREAAMPPIDRAALAGDPELSVVLDTLLTVAEGIEQPGPARAALEALRAADATARQAIFANVLADDIPVAEAATHLYAAAAVQNHLMRLAVTLDPANLVPVGTGLCPCCGGRPVASVVTRTPRLDGARYAVCAGCATMWNEVRVRCLCCGSTKGIGYRGLGEEAAIKAEVCDECQSWVKILYQTTDPALEPFADDVASLGLDSRMRETEWQRRGVNPWLVGF